MRLTEMCVVRHGACNAAMERTILHPVFDDKAARSFITIRRIESSTISIKYQLDRGFTTTTKRTSRR